MDHASWGLQVLGEESKEAMSGDDNEDDSEDSADEGQPAKAIKSPREPSRQEVEDHELAHVPFRDGCVHCFRGKSRNSHNQVNKSKAEGDKESAVATISTDLTHHREEQRRESECQTSNGHLL